MLRMWIWRRIFESSAPGNMRRLCTRNNSLLLCGICIVLFFSRSLKWWSTYPSDVGGDKSNNHFNDNYKHILALGDSLTAGLYKKNKFHPYSKHLTTLLSRNLIFTNYEVLNAGISNRGHHIKDIEKALESHLDKVVRMKLVIILSGTDDYVDLVCCNPHDPDGRASLFWKKTSEIFQAIKSLHSLCFRNNIHTITVSIPQIQWEDDPEYRRYKAYRLYINKQLKRFTQQHVNMTSFLDLSSMVESIGINTLKNTLFWDDGVHYTAYGYDIMAESVYKHIVKFFKEAEP